MNAKVIGIGILLLLVWAIMAISVPDSFLSANNTENLMRRTAMYGVLGIGVAFVIITAGIDLSIGSAVCLSGCLLTILLKVDYLPMPGPHVLETDLDAGTITVTTPAEDFAAGDQFRYIEERRPRSVVTITNITSLEKPKGTTQLAVTGLIANPKRQGMLVKVYPLKSVDQESGTLVIAGQQRQLAARDKIQFIDPKGVFIELSIDDAKIEGDSTQVHVRGDPSKIQGDWVAMPMHRHQRMPVLIALGIVMLTGILFGFTHGILVTKLHLQPFVVTLCGLLIYRGISRWSVNDQAVGLGNEYDTTLGPLATDKLTLWTSAAGDSFGIPYPFFIFILVAVLAAVFLNRTIWGRYMLALGRNEEAARFSGINTNAMTILAYVFCTALAALGGILFLIDANSISPSAHGNFFELYAIAAAVLGGCSLRGGEGSMLGVVIGTALMQTLYNLIVLMKIPDTLEFAIIGLVILIGVSADEFFKQIAARRRAARQQEGE